MNQEQPKLTVDPVLNNPPEHIGGSSFEMPHQVEIPEDPGTENICIGCE